jgi:uncharacterized protein
MPLEAEILVPGYPEERETEGVALKLSEPMSFWGGVSAIDGRLTGIKEKARGRAIGGTSLFIRELRGSSSASSVLLELIYRRAAPAALILDAPDAILALGVIVGHEMGWATPPLLRLPAAAQDEIPEGALVVINTRGVIRW